MWLGGFSMSKFTGPEVLEILKMCAESEAFNSWRNGAAPRDLFYNLVWLKSSWTLWFYDGVIKGATFMLNIRHHESQNTAEYQCLQHHFCLKREASQ
jgi:hypothetical protein